MQIPSLYVKKMVNLIPKVENFYAEHKMCRLVGVCMPPPMPMLGSGYMPPMSPPIPGISGYMSREVQLFFPLILRDSQNNTI